MGSFTMAAKILYGMDVRSIADYDTVHLDVQIQPLGRRDYKTPHFLF